MAENTTGDQASGAGANGTDNPNAPTEVAKSRGGQAGNPNNKTTSGGLPPGTSTVNPFAAYNFIVEVDDGQGGRLMLNARPRQGKVIRGRFDFGKHPGRIENEAMKPLAGLVIPGILIIVNGAKRMVSFVDPLGLKQNEALRKTLQAAIKGFTGAEQAPERTIELGPLQDDEMKSWIYWVRRHLDAKQVKVQRGTVPQMAEIERIRQGRIRHQVHDRDPKVEFLKSDFPYMAPGSNEASETLTADYEKEMNELFEGSGR